MENHADVADLLAMSPLFKGFTGDVLTNIGQFTELRDFGYGEVIWETVDSDVAIPLIVINEGCIGVVETSNDDGENDILHELRMPYQLLAEFQFLDDPWPPAIQLRAFSRGKALFVDAKFVNELEDADAANLYRNLAKMLVQKINLGDLTHKVRGMSGARSTLRFYITQLLSQPVWKRALRKTEKGEININIFWTVAYLANFISFDMRRVALALEAITKVKAAEIRWYDDELKALTDVSQDEIRESNLKTNRINCDTPFRFTNVRRDKLAQLRSRDTKPNPNAVEHD